MEHPPLSYDDWLQFFFMITFVSSMIAWLLSAKFTMRRIEPELKKQGFNCGSWDGPGFRVLSYATIILFQTKLLNDSNYPFVPVDATRKLATKKDWYISLWLWCSLVGMVFLVFLY